MKESPLGVLRGGGDKTSAFVPSSMKKENMLKGRRIGKGKFCQKSKRTRKTVPIAN